MIFRNWVLQNFPFLEDDFDALTDYELFCKMVEYMKESLDKVKAYQQELNEFRSELDSYKNYFDNLDVQEEIDNKLDEMAESGELTDIIAQYLGLAGVLAFNTVDDLANAENLVNGSICYCLGREEYNDKFGYFYKIREIKNTDVVDGVNIVALVNANNLVGELIEKYYIDSHNPIYYGADPTGVADSTDAINNCILANIGGTINFSQGVYNVTDSINLPFDNSDKVNINGNGAKIVASENITNLFYYGYDRSGNAINDVGFPCYIKDLFINGENATITNVFYQVHGFKDLHIENVNVYRCTNALKMGDSSTGSTVPCDTLVENCLFYGYGSEYDGVGVLAYNTDWNVNNTRIYGFRKGFLIKAYGSVYKTMVLLRWEEQTSANFDPYERNSETFNTYYEQTMFADVQSDCNIGYCSCDSMYKFLNIDTDRIIEFNGNDYFNARDNVNCEIFNIIQGSAKINISNCKFTFCKNNNCDGIKYTNDGLNNYGNVQITNTQYTNLSKITNICDPILANVPHGHNNINMSANTWYIIGCVANNRSNNIYHGTANIDGNIYDFKLNIDNNGNVGSITQLNKTTTATEWHLGGVKYKDKGLLLCVKKNTAANYQKPDLSIIKTHYQPMFQTVPVNNNHWTDSSRLLSDYTADTPSTSIILYTHL